MKTKKLLFIVLMVLVAFSVGCGKDLTVTLSGPQLVEAGKSIVLTATPSDSKATLYWKSSNDAVARVENGTVTGISAGKATITVTAQNEKKSGEAKLEVTVAPVQNLTNEAPVIHGAEDKTIEKGTTFIPLEGVTATDAEDGDIEVKYSGNVNVRKVGTYYATYTAIDSDGNTTTVTITVTVEFNDHDAPFLTGARDTTIVVGDTSFNLRDGVSAEDTVDGNLTNKIVIEGEVNVWIPGEYIVKYSVSDESNNVKEVTRIITVGFGEFKFDELTNLSLTKDGSAFKGLVSGGNISVGSLEKYAIAKLEFSATAAANTNMQILLAGATSQGILVLQEGTHDYIVYFRANANITDGQLELIIPSDADVTILNAGYAFAEARDEVAPVIEVPADTIVLPGNITDASVLKPFVLTGVTASDNIDGILTARLDVDFGDIVLGQTFEEKEVTIFVLDKSGNKAEAKRTVQFVNVYDTKLIKDPTFTEDIERATEDNKLGWSLNGGSGSPELNVIDGTLVHHNTTKANPGWDSASSPCFRTTTDVLNAGNWYMLKFDVKAEMARKMTIRIGLDTTEALSWIENFKGADNTPFGITTEWQTCYVLFYVHANKSQSGYDSIKFELKVGTFTWGGEEQGNTVYFDNLQVYLLTNENSAPNITLNENLPTTFGKGDAKPDLTKYVTAYDREDAEYITITTSHITESIDMNKAGEYLVTYRVSDSEGKEAAYVLKIKVLETADTNAPVISEKEGLVKEYDQFSAAPDITSLVTIVDDLDGEIAVTRDMIETNIDFNKAGSYDVKFTAKDSSGNEASLTIVIVINDKEAPVIEGKERIRVVEGSIVTADEIIASLTVTDNVDGEITLTSANLSGLDKVDFATAGSYPVIVTVSDAAGNIATFTKTIVVSQATQVVETLVNDILEKQPDIDSGSVGAATISYDEDGVATIQVTDVGTWPSFAMLKLQDLGLEQGKHYVVKVTAKADEARNLEMHIGIGLWAEPWIKYFTLENDSEKTFEIGTEYATYSTYFAFDQAPEAAGALIEFCFGQTGHAGDKAGNNIYVKELKIYEVSASAGSDTTTDLVKDILAGAPGIDSGSIEVAEVTYEDGVATISVSDVGTWASFAKMKFSELGLKEGHHYVLQVVAKADNPRYLEMHIGIGLWSDPWIDYFTLENGSEKAFAISTEYTENKVYFVYDKEERDSGPVIEFCFGQTGHDGDVAENNIYVKEIKIFEIVDEGGGSGTHEFDDKAANLTLDFSDQTVQTDLNSDDWNQYYYTDQWLETSGQMRVRAKDGVTVVNMFSANSMTYKYIYNENGDNIGVANKMTLKIGNYWSNAMAYRMKLVLIDVEGNYIYLLGGPNGSDNEWYDFPVTTGLEDFSFGFANTNIQSFMFICKSANPDYTYLYVGDIHITLEADSMAPEIKLTDEVKQAVNAGLVYTPGTNLQSIFATLLSGVSAVDDVDGNIAITENMINLGGLDLANPKAGKYTVTITVSDSAKNIAKLELPVQIKGEDGEFLDLLARQTALDSESASNAVVTYNEEGIAKVEITNVGEWASFIKFKLSNLGLVEGNFYALKIVAKADQVRNLEMHIGNALYADPWMDYYRIIEGAKTFEIGTEYAEYIILFQCDKAPSAGGPTIEFCMGKTGHSGDVSGNNIYISKISLCDAVPSGDVTAPEVLLNAQTQSALESKTFLEGTDESSTFQALLAGVSAIDDVDGRITVTADMVDLGGLNPSNLVKGKYTITISVPDQAGNVGKLEIPITVVGEYADLYLDFKDGTAGTPYKNSDWYQEWYLDGWVQISNTQMNCRDKDGVRVVNMTSGNGMAYNYRYNENGAPLGKANTITLKMGNYFIADALPIKVCVIDTEGNKHYALGNADDFYMFESTKSGPALKDITLHFASCNVQSIQFTVRYNGGKDVYGYLYIGQLKMSYETDTVAPEIRVDEDVLALINTPQPAGQDMTGFFTTCYYGIHIVDNFDGEIQLQTDNIDFGNLNIFLPSKGTYEVKINAQDSQGNTAQRSLTITIE